MSGSSPDRVGRGVRPALLIVVLGALMGCPTPSDERPEERGPDAGMQGESPSAMSPHEAEAIFADDTARVLADSVMEAMGGQDAWERTRFLAFRWLVERDGEVVSDRRHAWDRHEGRYKLEWSQNGTPVVALFDVDEVERHEELGKLAEGRAWRDGRELEGAARDSLLAAGYRSFINDTYWLLMPYKWRDPGVEVRYQGRDTLPDGNAYRVVHLSFEEDIGITNDQYWGFVDPATNRMVAWRFHLQGQEQPGPLIWWEEWRPVGPIQLSAVRRFEEGPARIRFENLQAGDEVPEGALAPPGDAGG